MTFQQGTYRHVINLYFCIPGCIRVGSAESGLTSGVQILLLRSLP